MTRNVTVEKAGTRIDPGVYQAVIHSFDEKDTEFGPAWVWKFRVIDPKLDGEALELAVISCPTTMKLTDHADNKLGQLIRATGLNYQVGENLNLDALIGTSLGVVVTDSKKKDMTFSKVIAFNPAVS